MGIADSHLTHMQNCQLGYVLIRRCTCIVKDERITLALSIDALVARRVEEERERCAKVCDEAARNRWNQHDDEFMQKTTVFAQRSGSHPTTVRYAASLLAAAIRATPPPLPSKETR